MGLPLLAEQERWMFIRRCNVASTCPGIKGLRRGFRLLEPARHCHGLSSLARPGEDEHDRCDTAKWFLTFIAVAA
jgi:hypothetical protein